MGNEEGTSWETTDVFSADTTDVWSTATTGVLSAETTDGLSTSCSVGDPVWRPLENLEALGPVAMILLRICRLWGPECDPS